MRILVVEDELHLSEALSHILKKNNYTVDVANDGETGLDNALSVRRGLTHLLYFLPQKMKFPTKFSDLTAVQTITSQSRLTPKNCLQE